MYRTRNNLKGAAFMTSYWKYGVVVLLLIYSCRSEDKPEGVMSSEEMTEFLLEMYLSEARIGSIPVSRDSGFALFYPREKALMEKRGLNDSTLKITYQYYLQRPEELEKIMDTVIDSLSLREQKLSNQP